jgi:U3 small nucleolar RNA-associated protein 11
MGLRNVVHRRNHKERSQPSNRSKFGLLEKHKDYIQRAKDHNVKKQRLQRLTQKASLRNPDEFNFGMIRGASKDLLKGGGLHVARRRGGDSEPMDNDLVAILKSQDLSYVRNVIRAEEKKIQELRQSVLPQLGFMTDEWMQSKDGREDVLHRQGLLQAGTTSNSCKGDQPLAMVGRKTVWVDDVDQMKSYKADNSTKKKKSQYSLDKNNEDVEQEQGTSKSSAEKRLGYLISQLDARQQRLDTLNEARSKLEVVRALMTTKGTNARKVQAKSDAIKSAVVNGKVTKDGLTAAADEDDDDDDEEDSLGEKKNKKKVTWKWGRERKR